MGSFMNSLVKQKLLYFKAFLLTCVLSVFQVASIKAIDTLDDIDDLSSNYLAPEESITNQANDYAPEAKETKKKKARKEKKEQKQKEKKVDKKKVSKKEAKKPVKKTKIDKVSEQVEKDKGLCDELRRDKAYNTNLIKQNQNKIDYLTSRDKTITPMITSLEKEIKALKAKLKEAAKKRTDAVKNRRSLCKERKKILKTMRKVNQPKIELDLNAITQKISTKIEERSKLSVEIAQLDRAISAKSQEHLDLKAEQKAGKDESFRLKKEITKLQKANDNTALEITKLECKIRESIPMNTPLEQ